MCCQLSEAPLMLKASLHLTDNRLAQTNISGATVVEASCRCCFVNHLMTLLVCVFLNMHTTMLHTLMFLVHSPRTYFLVRKRV